MSDPQLTFFNKGDWVSFMQGGRIVIGQVEYFEKNKILTPEYDTFFTTAGIVIRDNIFEVRRG